MSIYECALKEENGQSISNNQETSGTKWFKHEYKNNLNAVILSMPEITTCIMTVAENTIVKQLNLELNDAKFYENDLTSKYKVSDSSDGLEIKEIDTNKTLFEIMDCNSVEHALTFFKEIHFRSKTNRRESMNGTEVRCICKNETFKKKETILEILVKWILLCEYTRTSLGDTSEVGRSSNHTTEMNTPVDNDTNLSMTDKTDSDSPEEDAPFEQVHDEDYNSMSTENVDNTGARVSSSKSIDSSQSVQPSNSSKLAVGKNVDNTGAHVSSSKSIDSSQSVQPSNSSKLAVGKKKAQGNSNRTRKSTSQPQIRLHQKDHKDEGMLNNFIHTLAKKQKVLKNRQVAEPPRACQVQEQVFAFSPAEQSTSYELGDEANGTTTIISNDHSRGMFIIMLGYDIPRFEKNLIPILETILYIDMEHEVPSVKVTKVYRDGLILEQIKVKEDDLPLLPQNFFLSFRTLGILHNKLFHFLEVGDVDTDNTGKAVNAVNNVNINDLPNITRFLVQTGDQTFVETAAHSCKVFNIREEHLNCSNVETQKQKFKDEEYKSLTAKVLNAFKKKRGFIPRHILACTGEEELGSFRITVLQTFITTMTSIGALDPYVAAVSVFGMYSIHLLISDLEQMSRVLSHDKSITTRREFLKETIWCKDKKKYMDLVKTTCKRIVDKMRDVRWFDEFCANPNNEEFYRVIFDMFYNMLMKEENDLLEFLNEKQGYDEAKSVSGKSIVVCTGKVSRQCPVQAETKDKKSLFEVLSQGTCIIREENGRKFLTVCIGSIPKDETEKYKSNFNVALQEVFELTLEEMPDQKHRHSGQKTYSFETVDGIHRLMLAPKSTDFAAINDFIEVFQKNLSQQEHSNS